MLMIIKMSTKPNDDAIPKKVGGWAQETQIKPKELTLPQKSTAPDIEIPTIPDMDEVTENAAKENISIPKMSINKNVMYQELDSELLKQHSFATLDDVNLSALLKFIHLDANLKESDSVWTIDTLFKELAETDHKKTQEK